MPKPQTPNVCALCHKPAALCRSHVYPKFTFKRMKAAEGHFLKFSSARPKESGVPLHDDCAEHLLCLACEGRLQRWEDYFDAQVSAGVFDHLAPDPGNQYTWVQLDYVPTRLFLLSLLWRAHAAKSRNFQNVDLGSKHGEALRQMLLSGNPGEPWQYQCVISIPFIRLDGVVVHRPAVSMMPDVVRFSGVHGLRVSRFHLDGIFFNFVIGSDEVLHRFGPAGGFIQKSGRCIVGVTEAAGINFLAEAFTKTFFGN